VEAFSLAAEAVSSWFAHFPLSNFDDEMEEGDRLAGDCMDDAGPTHVVVFATGDRGAGEVVVVGGVGGHKVVVFSCCC
jgi:hypothetical protein